jgi:hypothetical protein
MNEVGKRARTEQPGAGCNNNHAQLLLANSDLRTRVGQKYCNEIDLVPLLLVHGLVRRVHTIEIEVRPLGGDSFNVILDAARTAVGDLKKEIASTQGTPQDRQELYRVSLPSNFNAVREDDAEPEMLDNEAIVLANKEVVTLAVKEEPLVWRTSSKEDVTLSDGGALATKYGPTNTYRAGYTLVTSGTTLTVGRHYWEVVLLNADDISAVCIGICRPDLNPTGFYGSDQCADGWFIAVCSGTLCGNGMMSDGWMNSNGHNGYSAYDRVGILLDLTVGSLSFFKNGVKNGPSYPPGSITGPVVHALQMYYSGSRQRLLPSANWPAGYTK